MLDILSKVSLHKLFSTSVLFLPLTQLMIHLSGKSPIVVDYPLPRFLVQHPPSPNRLLELDTLLDWPMYFFFHASYIFVDHS